MSNAPDSGDESTRAFDATVKRNAEVVRRGRRDRGFLKRLGLSLPVTVSDVKQAYFAKAREAHPDHKGSASDFKEVQRAFDEAVEFAERNGKRLPWLGAQMPIYVAQRAVVDIVEALGGEVIVQELDWLEGTVGEDFAQLADRLTTIDLTGLPVRDAQIEEIFEHADGVQFLETLLVADTEITDAGAMLFTQARSLKRLDLRGTDVSFSLRRQLAKLPSMEQVEGTSRWSELFRQG